MNRIQADRSDESEALRRAIEAGIADAPDENIERRQLRILCIGMAGMIVANVLILICFWTI